MAILKAVERKAKKLGASVFVSDEGKTVQITVESPSGYIWDANGCHCLVAHWDGTWKKPTWKENREEAIADLLERMEMGIDLCEQESCDYRHSIKEENL